ncbi:hypothetical protein PMAYCL1PPCAC_05547, partial [Pristionchus mayeri]
MSLVKSDQYWLFVLLRSFESGVFEVFSILITVLQAEHFTGNYLTSAIAANHVGLSLANLIASPINGLFVENKLPWQLGISVAPVLMIPVLILSAIFLRSSKYQAMPHPLLILQNAVGVFRIPSFVILVAAMCVDSFYSGTYHFWMTPMRLYAIEVYPEIFFGVSYTIFTTLTSTLWFIGGLCGSAAVPYLTRKLETATGICSCIPPIALALPLIYGLSQLIQSFDCLVEISMLTSNFPIFLASFIINGFVGAGTTLNSLKIKLATTPANQRSSAISVSKLLITITGLPSAQIFAVISDSIRGDSTSSIDHLEALQATFIYTWPIPLASSVLGFVLLRFYSRDVKKANEIDEREEEESAP